VAHSLIGDAFVRGLSGGEKRRVSIAVELLTQPGVLLLDEPTTGLDSTNAARVVDIMAALATSGVTVIMSIHQPRPDIFHLMDRVLLLSGSGEVRAGEMYARTQHAARTPTILKRVMLCLQVVYSGLAEGCAEHLTGLGIALPGSIAVPDWLLDTVIRSPRAVVVELVDGYKSSR
jgi:ABC-type multidrug transport system ATPase subunit